ncbi:hypothetical protein EMPS_00336 [Entomortierella parvispora]|uniref:PB1 domain-containing protein n=1 Tax=Entomortierella parvispora TaxID=205924 RepID=A0A9P3LRV9_9FUNG|nr:hypothetical protein EMPS_00336 [Entomortierella parvispora]
MIRNTLTNNLTLFCLVEGDSTPFPIKIELTSSIGELKDEIKLKKTPEFDDIAADRLTLWRVSIPVAPLNERRSVSLKDFNSAAELDPTDDVSDVFKETPPKKTIHVIVQPPSSIDTRSGDNKRSFADDDFSCVLPMPNKRRTSEQSQIGGYLDEAAFAVLRDKIHLKCHDGTDYDTRVVLVRVGTSFQELVKRVQEKFQWKRPPMLKYHDKDASTYTVTMVDDEDWLMFQQIHKKTNGTLELSCYQDYSRREDNSCREHYIPDD